MEFRFLKYFIIVSKMLFGVCFNASVSISESVNVAPLCLSFYQLGQGSVNHTNQFLDLLILYIVFLVSISLIYGLILIMSSNLPDLSLVYSCF